MADLKLSGNLKLEGTLDLSTDGGKVKVNDSEVLVEVKKGASGKEHGQAPAPVPIPPPPASPQDPELTVWIFKSFNSTVTVNGVNIVAQGMCAQGEQGKASWPGIVQRGTSSVTIDNIPINLLGDLGTILPTGAAADFSSSSGQE